MSQRPISDDTSVSSTEGPSPQTVRNSSSPLCVHDEDILESTAVPEAPHQPDDETTKTTTPSDGKREPFRTIEILYGDSSDDEPAIFEIVPKSKHQLIASHEGSAPQTIKCETDSSSRTPSPGEKRAKVDTIDDALSSLVEKASLSERTAPSSSTSPSRPDECVISEPRPLKHKQPKRDDAIRWERFFDHPWASLLAPTVSPTVCPYYDSDLRETRFERVSAAGYSGLNLFHKHSGRQPQKGSPVLILEAVGPVAIETFRKNHSYQEMLQMRTDGNPLPLIPITELAPLDLQTISVKGLQYDGDIPPVLYRVKALFGSGAKLEAVHIEIPFPDRLDLHTIHLDQFAVNIKTGMRGVDIHSTLIGDLIWVYSLVVTNAFAKSDTIAPVNVEEASQQRKLPVWRVARFALVHRELQDTLGYVIKTQVRHKGVFTICMQAHRAIVTASKNRLENPDELSAIRPNTFIVAPFRPRQLDYMMFACHPRHSDAELYAHMADVQYFPSLPPTPSHIRLPTKEHQDLVQSKLTKFELFATRPNEVMQFLEPIYNTTCGTIAACIAEASDQRIHSTVWSSPDINSFPALVIFDIPISNKSGWSVGRYFEGAYQTDLLKGRITAISVDDQTIHVTAELLLEDTTRFRTYMLHATHNRIAVGTCLHSMDSKANPVLAMLEKSLMSRTFEPHTPAWNAARAILAGDEDLWAVNAPERTAITVNVAGTKVDLNKHQVNAINWFHKDSPILIIDSAYGAGKSLCTAVMAEDAVKLDQIVLVAAVQNSALDVICAKIAELNSQNFRPVRYINETLARDVIRETPYDVAKLMENLAETHKHALTPGDLKKFQAFARDRIALRDFVFTGIEKHVVAAEHKKLLLLDSKASQRVKVLMKTFLKTYKPNVFLCTIASALNLTTRGGLWRQPSRQWSKILLDEASMIPEATLLTLMSRFQQARYTLVGDSKQLPPYVGVNTVPLAVALSSQSILDIANRMGNAPVCKISTVYRPHEGLMSLNSTFFYDGQLICGTPAHLRQGLLRHIKMPNPDIPLAFVNVVGHSVKSVTSSHSNEVEANAVLVLVRTLMISGIKPADVAIICLYRDQKHLCEYTLRGIGVTVNTVDSAQGSETSIIILCTTRTHLDPNGNHSFFADSKRLNVALSRARDGMFILGYVPHLVDIPLWGNIIRWCRSKKLLTELTFFDSTSRPNVKF